LLAALYIIVRRHDLVRDSLMSGVAVMATMFIAYALLWYGIRNGPELLAQSGLSDDRPLSTLLFGAPLTELIWGFAIGMLIGPAYEYLRNYRLSRS
jgi:hypothetical protein